MNFGIALALLKAGKRVAREGWNGKGMFVYLVGAGRYPPSTPSGHFIANDHMDGCVPYRPYLAMLTVDGDVVPWVASQTDILADDWRLEKSEKIDIDTIDSAGDELEAEAAETGQEEAEVIITQVGNDLPDDWTNHVG